MPLYSFLILFATINHLWRCVGSRKNSEGCTGRKEAIRLREKEGSNRCAEIEREDELYYSGARAFYGYRETAGM